MAQLTGKAATDATLPGLNPTQTGVTGAATARTSVRSRQRNEPIAYLFLLPAVLVLAVFSFFPLFFAFYISLYNWKLRKLAFIGWQNYQEALHKPDFWESFGNTIFFVIGTVPFTMALALFFAFLLFQKVRFLSFFRTIYFLPYVTSTVAAAAVWTWIFNARSGVMNALLGNFGVNLRWLQESRGIFYMLGQHFGATLPGWAHGPSLALTSIMAMTTWHLIGFDIVIFLAGLGNISKELYEAARIDGASEWLIFRRITMPLLMPTIYFLTIISSIAAFKAFNEIYVMSTTAGNGSTAGNPLGSTQTLVIYVYNQFYSSARLGYGSAIAFLLFAAILALTLVQLWFGRRREVEA